MSKSLIIDNYSTGICISPSGATVSAQRSKPSQVSTLEEQARKWERGRYPDLKLNWRCHLGWHTLGPAIHAAAILWAACMASTQR